MHMLHRYHAHTVTEDGVSSRKAFEGAFMCTVAVVAGQLTFLLLHDT